MHTNRNLYLILALIEITHTFCPHVILEMRVIEFAIPTQKQESSDLKDNPIDAVANWL